MNVQVLDKKQLSFLTDDNLVFSFVDNDGDKIYLCLKDKRYSNADIFITITDDGDIVKNIMINLDTESMLPDYNGNGALEHVETAKVEVEINTGLGKGEKIFDYTPCDLKNIVDKTIENATITFKFKKE